MCPLLTLSPYLRLKVTQRKEANSDRSYNNNNNNNSKKCTYSNLKIPEMGLGSVYKYTHRVHFLLPEQQHQGTKDIRSETTKERWWRNSCAGGLLKRYGRMMETQETGRKIFFALMRRELYIANVHLEYEANVHLELPSASRLLFRLIPSFPGRWYLSRTLSLVFIMHVCVCV